MPHVIDVVRDWGFISCAAKALAKRRLIADLMGRPGVVFAEYPDAMLVVPVSIIFNFDPVDVAMKFGGFDLGGLKSIFDLRQLFKAIPGLGLPVARHLEIVGAGFFSLRQFSRQPVHFPRQARLRCRFLSVAHWSSFPFLVAGGLNYPIRLNSGPVRRP